MNPQWGKEALMPVTAWQGLAPAKNTSGIEPRGHAVLIQPYEPEAAGLVQLPDQVKFTQLVMNQRAIVIAVGPSAWCDEVDARTGERVPRAAPGDRVLVTKMAGFIAAGDVTADGKTYRLVNDRDIFAVLTEERQNG